MGTSSDGQISYGITLNEEEYEELEKRIFSQTDKATPDNDRMEEALFTIDSGKTFETHRDTYVKDLDKFLETLPVEIIMHCSYDYPMYIIAVRGTNVSAYRGYPKELDFSKLNPSEKQVKKYKKWLDKNGLGDKEPKWILSSLMG